MTHSVLLAWLFALMAAVAGTVSRIEFAGASAPQPDVFGWLRQRGFVESRKIPLTNNTAHYLSEMAHGDTGCAVLVTELEKPEAVQSLIARRVSAAAWDARGYWLGDRLTDNVSSWELVLWRLRYRLVHWQRPPVPALVVPRPRACVERSPVGG